MAKKPTLDEHRHFILYAKGYYKRSEQPIEDLRKLIANFTGNEERYVSINDIFWNIWDITVPHILSMTTFANGIDDLGKIVGGLIGTSEKIPVGKEGLVEKVCVDLLNKLSNLKVKRKKAEGGAIVVNLGKPDSNILPLAKD